MLEKEGKRIAVLSYDFKGQNIHNRAEIEWKLARDGYAAADSFLIICWSKKRETIRLSERIVVESFPAFVGAFRPLYDILFIFVAPYIARRDHWKPQIIAIGELPLVWGAWMLRAFTGGEIIVRLIGLPRDLAKTRSVFHYWYTVVNEFLGKRIPERFIVINDATRAYALRIGVPEERIEVVAADSIGIDGALIANAPHGVARKELGIPDGVPMVLSVGRLEPEKAFDELIRTFVAANIDAWLVILGEGVLRPRLEALIRELGAQGKVILLGRKERRDVWKYYKDADAFALVSLTEGIGLVFWEAIYAGAPVIGRPVGGVKETIGEDGLRGFFWDSADGAYAFREKLERCFSRSPDIEAMKARAYAYVAGKIGNTEGASA